MSFYGSEIVKVRWEKNNQISLTNGFINCWVVEIVSYIVLMFVDENIKADVGLW